MKQYFTILFFLLSIIAANAQDAGRFKEQIAQLDAKEYNFNSDKKLVVFTGSSSITMWKNVQDYFPKYNVINNGFGGSQYTDLLLYYDQIILKQKPDILFIYEGDNDIASGKEPSEIAGTAKMLIKKIRSVLPGTRIMLISTKPSITRWELRASYEKLNTRLYKIAKRNEKVDYVDVWNVMLDKNGIVCQDIFLKDGVHMNRKGYDIWAKEINQFLNR